MWARPSAPPPSSATPTTGRPAGAVAGSGTGFVGGPAGEPTDCWPVAAAAKMARVIRMAAGFQDMRAPPKYRLCMKLTPLTENCCDGRGKRAELPSCPETQKALSWIERAFLRRMSDARWRVEA